MISISVLMWLLIVMFENALAIPVRMPNFCSTILAKPEYLPYHHLAKYGLLGGFDWQKNKIAMSG